MDLKGKGIFIWKIRDCEGGDVTAIADLAEAAGLSHIVIKIADGAYSYNYDFRDKVDFVPPLVTELRKRGISPWGWHYVRGDAAGAEARKAVERVKNLGLDGYAIDAEHEYKGRYDSATTFMDILRKELPNTPIALASYRFPSLHPTLPWRNFLAKCDLNMPQMYWQGASNPKVQLQRCREEFDSMNNRRPVVPIGAAYTEHGWTPKPGEVVDFLDEARRLEMTGANFWEWAQARRVGLWDTIAGFDWDKKPKPVGPPVEPPDTDDITYRYIAALNARKPDAVITLFKPDAIHVDPRRTLQGTGEIIGWYADFFVRSLPQGSFRLTAVAKGKSVRRFSWMATVPGGKVVTGSDVFGLFGGRIGFHSTTYAL
jgi:hypothetical protein